MMLRLLRFVACILFSSNATAACYQEAAERYGVPEPLLRAIAHVESGSADARTVENRNPDGTRDIGRMQINTGWLPTLKRFGISEASLRDECVSIHVGAWIMANNMSQHGGLSWKAVGAYNVGCLRLSAQECEMRRNSYSWRVYRALQKQGALTPTPQAAQPTAPPATSTPSLGGSRIASVTLASP